MKYKPLFKELFHVFSLEGDGSHESYQYSQKLNKNDLCGYVVYLVESLNNKSRSTHKTLTPQCLASFNNVSLWDLLKVFSTQCVYYINESNWAKE